ncbi:Cytochrome bo(3) ubiquinol oxidase subunit 3 [Buchnera aphidicola (Cinara piceae)]|uniref:Cytochrome bo(3) ubiquinol oxidase subunit 3 n=1 Tax=Buchnera aphidicola (Cinara piceae) TaxID=1660043 RepID=A0A803FU88_9GAMM|nr:cytochrome c oxidase subunit 3 [Buchnera aphidicola]VFP88604.1 Cytochrome bo(3) ubiquinol oxidase subunit 3 [Buchnera aphidicola (Cinara piceae)]
MNEKKKCISYSSLENKNIFGTWIYLMSDCIIFAVLFIVHIIMSRHGYSNFLKENHLFSPSIVLIETLILLFSSLSCSLIKYFSKYSSKVCILIFLFFTFILGSCFLGLECVELLNIFYKGFYPFSNGYLSSFFALLGMHGLHIFCGLLWLLILIGQIFIFNLTDSIHVSLVCFCLFWHFLDVIWTVLIMCVYFR